MFSAMKRILLIIPAVLLIISCEKQQTEPEPTPKPEPTIPELVEKDLMNILSKDWQSVADTIQYFRTNIINQGKTKGTGPDGVYYELNVNFTKINNLEATFKVQDSIWVKASGQIYPLEIKVRACDTDLKIKRESGLTTSLTIEKIQAIFPDNFLIEEDIQAPLLYNSEEVGYLTRTEMENLDYTTGKYLIVHYNDDPRTFALYDGGLSSLIEIFGISYKGTMQKLTK